MEKKMEVRKRKEEGRERDEMEKGKRRRSR